MQLETQRELESSQVFIWELAKRKNGYANGQGDTDSTEHNGSGIFDDSEKLAEYRHLCEQAKKLREQQHDCEIDLQRPEYLKSEQKDAILARYREVTRELDAITQRCNQLEQDEYEAENARILEQERPVEKEETDAPGEGRPLKAGEFTVVVRCAKHIEPETVDYLWYPYFPLGKLGLLGGDAGVGKTYITAAIATSHSRGTWPFFLNGKESIKEPGHTLIFSCEDGVEDTYIPRLISLGANRDFIHFVDGKRDWKGNLRRILMTDRDILTRVIRDHSARLVVFDPLQSFLPPKAEMSKMETVRPVVDALAAVARDTKSHILLIGHLSKAKQETAGYKFLGSVDWYNAARSAMLATINPEDRDTERFFHHIKHSLGPKAPGMRFSISEENVPPFLWGQATDVTIEDVLSGGDTHTTSKEAAAEEFLKGELADGEQAADDIKAAAKALQISWRTVWRAKEKLKIQARKDGFRGPWLWSLPPNAA